MVLECGRKLAHEPIPFRPLLSCHFRITLLERVHADSTALTLYQPTCCCRQRLCVARGLALTVAECMDSDAALFHLFIIPAISCLGIKLRSQGPDLGCHRRGMATFPVADQGGSAIVCRGGGHLPLATCATERQRGQREPNAHLHVAELRLRIV